MQKKNNLGHYLHPKKTVTPVKVQKTMAPPQGLMPFPTTSGAQPPQGKGAFAPPAGKAKKLPGLKKPVLGAKPYAP